MKPRTSILESGITSVKCRRPRVGNKDLWNRYCIVIPLRGSKELLRLSRGDFENDPVSRRSGKETLWGDRLDLFASGGIRARFHLYIAAKGRQSY